jgi:hypothetical protein
MMRREKLGKPLLILGLANITISQVMMVFDCAEGIARTNIKLKRELASIFQALSTQNKGEIARLRKDMEPKLMTKDEREVVELFKKMAEEAQRLKEQQEKAMKEQDERAKPIYR